MTHMKKYILLFADENVPDTEICVIMFSEKKKVKRLIGYKNDLGFSV